MKQCLSCGLEKARHEFHASASASDGLQSWCRQCKAESAARYRAQDPERHAERIRAWRQRNPYANRDSVKRWAQGNPEKVAANNAAQRRIRRAAQASWRSSELVARVYRLARALRSWGLRVVVDHWLPLKGKDVCGLHVQDNLVLIDARCNGRKKNHRPPDTQPPAIAVPRAFRLSMFGCGR
jgi:hypothetical protein